MTTPDPTAITDAYALMKLLSTSYHEKHFNLVVNMVSNEDEALDVYRKLSIVSNRYLDISIDYLGSIPSDQQMSEAIRKQQAIVELFPNSTSAAAFHALAKRLATMTTRRYPKGSVQFFWKLLLRTDAS